MVESESIIFLLLGGGTLRGMVYSRVVLLVGGTPRGWYCKGDSILGGSTTCTKGWYSQGMVL